jgi:hypothetical protein
MAVESYKNTDIIILEAILISCFINLIFKMQLTKRIIIKTFFPLWNMLSVFVFYCELFSLRRLWQVSVLQRDNFRM